MATSDMIIDNSEEQDIDNSEEQDIPPTRYYITSYGADYPVDGLVKRIERGDIIVPNFQRAYVWKIEQASRFIESLLLGLPVPGIFLAKDENNKLIIIDGQQRLRTLESFYKGIFVDDKVFKLSGVAKQFEGVTYKTLLASDRRMLDDSIIPATIVRQEEPEESDLNQSSIYHIFERLNTGGSKLFPQEIRSCIYYGEFNNFLDKLNKNEVWQKIFQGKDDVHKPDIGRRMKDQELILRFLALYLDFDNYKTSNMKEFLNNFMLKNRNLEQHSSFDLTLIFTSAIDVIYQSIGIKAFRPRRGLHAAVFDAIMVGLAKRLKDKGKIQDLNAFSRAYEQLLESEEFREKSINSRQISDIKNVKARIDLATEAFMNVV
ncbi:DUF262 domain-containing protein [Spirulina major]|uniref:DUF262 domain-containing protein n=1 Tax=Spirulina major TaxID=270636 RepID=UPI000B038073|nr:DUF262 domain-containing protein [Spirulina major]